VVFMVFGLGIVASSSCEFGCKLVGIM